MIIENKLKPFSLLESSQYIEPDFNLYLMVEEYDNGNLVYLDNIKTICEEYNHTYEEINEYLNEEYDNSCYTVINEEDIIKDPEIVNIFENYIVRELPDSDIVSQYTEYLVDKYIDTFDESYLDFIYEPYLLLESRDKELDLYRSMARILRGKVGKINPELGTKFRQFHYNGSRNDLISIKSDIKNLMNKDSNFSKAVEKAIIKAPTAEYRVGRLSANDQHDEYGKYTSTTNTGDKVSSFNPELTNFKDFRVLRNIAIDLGFENKMKKDKDGDFEDDFGEDLDNLRDVLVRKGRRTKDNNDKDYLIDRRSTATKSNRIFTQDPENVGKSYRDIIDDLLDKGKIKSAEMVLNKYKNLVNASSSRLKDVNDDVVDQKSKKNISDVIDYFYNKTKNKIESSKKKQTPNSGGKTINSSSIESLEQEQKNKPIIDKNQFDKSAQDKFSKSMLFRQLIQDRTQHTTSQSSTKGFTDEDTLNKLNNYFNKNNIGNSEEEKSRYTKEAIALLNKRFLLIK